MGKRLVDSQLVHSVLMVRILTSYDASFYCSIALVLKKDEFGIRVLVILMQMIDWLLDKFLLIFLHI